MKISIILILLFCLGSCRPQFMKSKITVKVYFQNCSADTITATVIHKKGLIPKIIVVNPDLGRATFVGCDNCDIEGGPIAFNVNRVEIIKITYYE